MARYIFKRLLFFIPILLGVSIICFSMIHMIPGDIVDILAGEDSLSPERRAQLLAELGLDKPIWLQWLIWLGKVLQGDLGFSFATGVSVSEQILHRLPVNVELLIIASVFMIIMGIGLGMASAAFENTRKDYLIRFAAILGYCIPNFWLATIFVLLSSVYIPWLPVIEYVEFSVDPLRNITSLIIPGFVIGLASLSFVVRMTRSSVLETMRQDYVRTARAKGLTEKIVFFKHVLKNSLIPVVTVLGIQISHLIGGFVLTEEVFVLPGIGRLLLNSILNRDFPIITGIILLIAFICVVANLLVDILYSFLDPKIKY